MRPQTCWGMYRKTLIGTGFATQNWFTIHIPVAGKGVPAAQPLSGAPLSAQLVVTEVTTSCGFWEKRSISAGVGVFCSAAAGRLLAWQVHVDRGQTSRGFSTEHRYDSIDPPVRDGGRHVYVPG